MEAAMIVACMFYALGMVLMWHISRNDDCKRIFSLLMSFIWPLMAMGIAAMLVENWFKE